MREITPREYASLAASGTNPFLLDVREGWELALAAAPGAVHIPMGEIPDRLAEIPADREIVVMCKACLLYTSPSPRDGLLSRMPSSA